MELLEKESLALSVVMPCRNEENTVAYCIQQAKKFMQKHHISGEVLVVDNASTDASAAVAARHGARVVTEQSIGYGNALKTGIIHTKGSVIIMGDCDTTYDFEHMEEMYRLLAENECDMVIGNRYAGGMEPGSMPWSHRVGVRVLSFLAGKRFHSQVYDFHCGLRGFTRQTAEHLELCTEGMEFATELIAEAAACGLCIGQVPVTLGNCRFERSSKLRTVRDGFRHLKYILKKGR